MLEIVVLVLSPFVLFSVLIVLPILHVIEAAQSLVEPAVNEVVCTNLVAGVSSAELPVRCIGRLRDSNGVSGNRNNDVCNGMASLETDQAGDARCMSIQIDRSKR